MLEFQYLKFLNDLIMIITVFRAKPKVIYKVRIYIINCTGNVASDFWSCCSNLDFIHILLGYFANMNGLALGLPNSCLAQ